MVRFHGLASWLCYFIAIVGGSWLFIGLLQWLAGTAIIGVFVGYVLDVTVSLLEWKYRRLFPDTEPRGRSFVLYGIAVVLALAILALGINHNGPFVISTTFAVATAVDLLWALIQKLSSPKKVSPPRPRC